MVNAQNWLDTKFNKNSTNIVLHDERTGLGGADDDKELTGELLVKDFANLVELNLERKTYDGQFLPNNLATGRPTGGKMTKVVIENCPALQSIDLDDNEITEIIFVGDLPNLTKLDVQGNKLTRMTVCNFPSVKTLNINSNADFTSIENLWGLGSITGLTSFDFRDVNHGNGLDFSYLNVLRSEMRKVLGISSGSLPNSWRTDLASKLGGKNLKDIPTGQTLKSLIDLFGTDKGTLQNQLTQAKAELDKQKDYDTIKAERDNLKQQLDAIKSELGLGNDATQKQITDEINNLKGRPTTSCAHTDYDAIKSERDRLKTENENKDRKISELENANKENMGAITKKALAKSTKVNLAKWGVNVSNNQKETIQDSVSAEKVEEVRNKIINDEFNKLKDEKNNSFYLNVGLGALTIGSLLILGWLIMRETNLPKIEPDHKKTKKQS